MMDYNASITYTIPVTPNVERAEEANDEGRFLGLSCPVCGRTYTGGKGYCPVDAIELTHEHEVDLPQRGTVTNYTIITPMQYPGQTETEPFSARARVARRHRRGARLPGAARRAERRRAHRHAGRRGVGVGGREGATRDPRAEGNLVGWMPTGEPDVDDPNLVNRI